MIVLQVFYISFILAFILCGSIGFGIEHKSTYDEIENSSNFLRVCYLTLEDLPISKINGTLCTHVIRGFATIQNGVFYPGTTEDVEKFILTTELKINFPKLKIMISIGGGGMKNPSFSVAMSSQQHRLKLINSLLDFLIKYKFDGLDIDWEFPVWNDNVKEDRNNFILFLQDFRKISQFRCNRPFILSVAVAGPKTIIDVSYDISGMAKYIDFINLMSYDYHDYTFYTPFTGHNSPLFNRSVEKEYFSTLNTAWSSFYWNTQGMPLNKIMVGLPTYGHTYKLLDSAFHNVDSPAADIGSGGGTSTYPEICDFLRSGAKRVFDNESKVPYAYKDYDWISYDDIESLIEKAKFVKLNGFGGVMTFDLNCDDWQGYCDNKTTFPLHQAIYDTLLNDETN